MIDSKLLRSNFFKLYQFSRGNGIFKKFNELEETQWLSYVELQRMQWFKVRKILKYSYKYVPYYNDLFKELNLTPDDIRNSEDLNKIPILTKDKISDNIEKLQSILYREDELIKNSTGGSTGKNLNFFNDGNRIDIRGAINLRGDKWAGLNIGTKHAYLWGSPLDNSIQNKLKERIYNWINGRVLFLNSYDLSERNMLKYLEKINKKKPKIIVSYPSSLYFFAKFLKNKEITLNLKSVITSGETLYEYQRDLIESVFCCKIFDRYGCREFGSIAQECSEHNGLHINMEHILLECLSSENKKKMGLNGEFIITDLDNYGMPFIRYKIEDSGVIMAKKCECGRNLPLISIAGRSFDIIKFGDKNIDGHFFSILLRTNYNGINNFQVIQKDIDKILLNIVIDNTFKFEYIENIRDVITKISGSEVDINIEIVDEIPLTPSGKSKFVISEIN